MPYYFPNRKCHFFLKIIIIIYVYTLTPNIKASLAPDLYTVAVQHGAGGDPEEAAGTYWSSWSHCSR